MNMTEGEIRSVIRDELDKYFTNAPFVVQIEEHFVHHQQLQSCIEHKDEWQSNHDFVKSIRLKVDSFSDGFWKRLGQGAALVILAILALVLDWNWLSKLLSK